MKKLLIASAALAMVAGTAQAQSSVTVYGTYDLGYQALSYDNIGGSTATSAQDKVAGMAGSALTSNRIGFRGTEDLGGGMKANFNLEYGFASNLFGDTVTTSTTPSSAMSSGALAAPTTTPGVGSGLGGTLQTRTSRVGLESAKLGRLDVGYGLTGLFATVTGHSPLPGNNFIGDVAYTSQASSGATAAGTHAGSATSRILAGAVRANGVQYTSPSMGGLQAVVDYGTNSVQNGDSGATDTRVQNAGLTLRYSAGALALAGTVHNLKTDANTENNNISSADFAAISARYAVTSSLNLNVLYSENKTTNLTTGLQSGKNDVTQVGVSYTMGKNQLVAQYGEGNGETTTGAGLVDRKGYQLAAIHNLSKRTNVYAIYGSQEGKLKSGDNSGKTEKVSGYSVGVRHSF
jgi:predicted porin